MEIDLEKEQLNLDIALRYQEKGTNTSRLSKASMFKELPSYVGDYESRDDVRRVPTQYKPTTEVLDTANLQALLSAPIRVSLPLADVLKVRPEL